ncbi:porin [Pararhodonellum marinum]|uniref:porin n=1 Tax=Pararhodonellum marinum TaxID=2755358 RepID=UPI00188E342B|nr:porin [Pararhodonellum marinum]
MRGIFFLIILLNTGVVRAQYYSEKESPFSFEGYAEVYYSYDFNRPDDHLRPDVLFNFKRHNEFSVNHTFIKVAYKQERVRSNLALMAGTYSQFNLAEEPPWAQMLYEASVGVRLLEKMWLDVGIMPSHIGFESAEGIDCWHLSRSLLAENSPYFLTGARLTYHADDKLDLTFWLTNGWQNVQRINRNQSIGIGLGINHRPIEGLTINYSNYYGNEFPQNLYLARFFNNFYAQYVWGNWGVTIGADHGVEASLGTEINKWTGLTASLKRDLSPTFTLAGRAEYYTDPKGVILVEGMKVSGLSLNLDYKIQPNVLARIEGRQLFSPEPVFDLPAGLSSTGNFAMTMALAVRF